MKYVFLISLSIFTFCVILHSKNTSASNFQYKSCIPKNCGHGPNINFPFYILGLQEPYCGYPGFALNCSENGFPSLRFSETKYVINDIFYQNRSLHIQNSAVFGWNDTSCALIRNTTLPATWFSYSNTRNLYLFYNCTNPLPARNIVSYTVGCDDVDNWDMALYDTDERLRNATENCERNVIVPVQMHGFDNNVSNGMVDVIEVLRRGLVLNWTASDCHPCENSGGRCGFNLTTYSFRCFCRDKPHYMMCIPDRNRVKWWIWLIVVAVGTLGTLLLLSSSILIYFIQMKHEITGNHKLPLHELVDKVIRRKCGKVKDKDDNMNQVCMFSFGDIKIATNNFSYANKLGEGGFGPVYKGQLLNGQEVAIKRLSRSSGQGLEEFQNEIQLTANLQHKNLVRLLGSCIQRQEMILVYEYMPNKSLDFFLFEPDKRDLLKWTARMHIIEGIAQGLVYLHKYSRLRVIHRDLKTSNILLDQNMNPKISDFGLARIFEAQESETNTKRIVGTRGYMSPEYLKHGTVSTKTDVFSFGVLLLEIISGKRNRANYDSERPLNLIGLAWELWVGGKALELMDQTLTDPNHNIEVMRCLTVGLLCVQDSPSDRPSMIEVVYMLKNEYLQLPTPNQPAFFIDSNSQVGKEEILSKTCTNGLSVSLMEAR